jgi:hypothetical protein
MTRTVVPLAPAGRFLAPPGCVELLGISKPAIAETRPRSRLGTVRFPVRAPGEPAKPRVTPPKPACSAEAEAAAVVGPLRVFCLITFGLNAPCIRKARATGLRGRLGFLTDLCCVPSFTWRRWHGEAKADESVKTDASLLCLDSKLTMQLRRYARLELA